MSYDFRMGTSNDSASLFDLMVDAYQMQDKPDRIEAARGWTWDHPEQYLVMEEDGQIVAALHIGDTWIQVGRSAVLKGDVGHVAVPTELQGMGLGTRLMRHAVEHMRRKGYHLSRLGGLVHFYTRFGYEPFPRRFVVFEVQDFTGGAGRITPADAYPEPRPERGLLRPFDEARDRQALADIRYAFHDGRSGSEVVRPEAATPVNPAPPDPDALRFVYELDGRQIGFLFADENAHEARPGREGFSIGELCYDPAHPEAPGLLLRMLLSRIAHRAPLRISSRLPYDEAVTEAVQAAGVGFDMVETRHAVASNQIMVVNLSATLEAILPELTARLADSLVADWTGAVEFALPAETATIVIDGGHIEVGRAETADLPLTLTQAQFVKALFGICGAVELPPVRAMGLDATRRALLDALFPRTPTGSGPWG
ncbi:MAG: GNAT family N-acetyltransferase [Armatimonadetes bacterium]|nr:GNAT family N-acetyltransferase [Armatimonadota bacterium]